MSKKLYGKPVWISTATFTPKESPYLVTLFNLYSKVCAVPFEVTKDGISGEFLLHRSLIRKVLCFVVHIMITSFMSIWIASSVWRYFKVRHDVSSTFYVTSQLATMGAITSLQKVVLFKQEALERFIRQTSIISGSAVKEKVTTVMIVLGIALISYTHGFFSQQTTVDAKNMVDFLRHVLSPLCRHFNLHPLQFLKTIVPPKILLGIQITIYNLSYAVFNASVSSMLILSLTTLHLVKNDFCVGIHASYTNVQQALEHYKRMKEYTVSLRVIFSGFVTSYYVSVLSFIAELPQIVLLDSETSTRIIMGTYMIIICLGVGTAAKAHSEVDECWRSFITSQQWARERSTNERLQLIALSQDLDREPIGISCGFFTITRNFLSSSFGLVVTYSIIIFQMSENESVFWVQ